MVMRMGIGKKIKLLRTGLNLSREEFCKNGKELSTRQLGRIESGKSLPTLTKMVYIANQLSVPVSILLNEEIMLLPKEYKKMKKNLYQYSVYSNKENLSEQEAELEMIYKHYYELVPEEEQLILEFYRVLLEKNSEQEAVQKLLDHYLKPILKKENLEENDLIFIYLYLHHYKEHDGLFLTQVANKILRSSIIDDDTDVFLLNQIIIELLFIYGEKSDYGYFPEFIKKSRVIISNRFHLQKKPIIDMLEGKYYLFEKKEYQRAEEIYQKAAQLARLQEDSLLAEMIEKEWEIDSNTH